MTDVAILESSHPSVLRNLRVPNFVTVRLSILRYLELLDWTGRQLRSDKRGVIPKDIAPILEKLGIRADRWLDLASRFGNLFKRAAGSSISITAEANRRGQGWMQGPGQACFD